MKTKAKQTINNNCTECAHFVKHYANLHGKFYLVSGCKHCVNNKLSVNERDKRMSNKVKCEYWQPEQKQIDERKRRIEEYLVRTANQLQEIAQILKEDAKDRK